MYDKRFLGMFGLSEAEAIRLLDAPMGSEEGQSRYVAACELANYPTAGAIAALTRAIENTAPELNNRIVRRKAVETLGRLKASQALPIIGDCLKDEDNYTVENAVWSIGEIGTDDESVLAAMAALLDKPEQTYRVIIHTLAKLGYQTGVEKIRGFVDHEDKTIASAAMTAIARLTGDRALLQTVTEFLFHPNVYTRRLCIQDLIDAQYWEAIPEIAKAPVSVVFRLRGIRALADAGHAAGKLSFTEVQPPLEKALYDHPQDITMVHEYDPPPTLAFLIDELFQTDFGRCYLGSQILLTEHRDAAKAAVMAAYMDKARSDYGAHYHVMKLMGWLKLDMAYGLIVSEGLNNPQPQFLKSRYAAALTLGELGDRAAIAPRQACLDSPLWTLKYAALLALEKLGDRSGLDIASQDDDWLIRAKAQQLSETALAS
ncbi:MAG: HEAT repeat domain-containing protein [Synechococcales cyanobacterium CRU_2_2]|nr:HEAT repeat domain-containing protein [Synechococcales cyanobacterium CRU_2_2]